MITGNRFVQCMPELFDFINPWAIDRLKQQTEFRVLFQPQSRFSALMNDVVINNKRDGFGFAVFTFKCSNSSINSSEHFDEEPT